MLGQVKFAWIDFKRSIIVSGFSFFSQIITFSIITISLSLFSIVKNQLKWLINSVFYKSYNFISILFIVVSIIIGSIVIIRSIDLKFQSNKDDIAIMKNVGGKNRWIYSYFIFNQMFTTIIMLLFGLFLGLILLLVVFTIFGSIGLFQYVLFLPILLANLSILGVSYIKSHYKIIKFIGETDFEETSGKLSKYKSIFEFNRILKNTKTVTKIAFKNFLRSGKIISSLIFSFFLIFSTISFILGPTTLSNTYLYQLDNRFNQHQYIIGDPVMIDFYNSNIEFQKYKNESLVDEIDISNYFSGFTLNSTLINSIESRIASKQEIFLSKLKMQEIPSYEINSGVYIPIGSNQSFYATVIGYQNKIINQELFLWGEEPDRTKNQVLIGDSLNSEIFENSSIEKLQFIWDEPDNGFLNNLDTILENKEIEKMGEEMKLYGESDQFSITGVIMDSFASGFTVYLPLNQIEQELIATGPNLIIIDDLGEVEFDNLKDEIESYGYEIQNLVNKIKDFERDYKNFSNLYNLLSGSLFVIFSFQFIVFGILYYSTYRKDYELLYKLGISKRKIYATNIIAIILQLMLGIILGIYFGGIFARYLLVPDAVFSFFSLIIIGQVIWCILLVILGSSIATKRSLKNVII